MRFALLTALFFLVSLGVRCSTPTNNDTIAWESRYTLPLVKKELKIAEALGLGAGSNVTISEDSVRYGDTLCISLTDTFVTPFRKTLLALDSFSFSYSVDSLVFPELDSLVFTFDLKKLTGGDGTFSCSSLFPSDGKGGLLSDTLLLKNIERLNFGDFGDSITARITNHSPATAIHNLCLRVGDEAGTFSALEKPLDLSPLETCTARLGISGTTLSSLITADMQAALTTALSDTSGDSLTVTLDLRQLPIKELLTTENLPEIKFGIDLLIPLGDPFCRIRHLDCEELSLPLFIQNGTPLELFIDARVGNCWDRTYCESNGFETDSSLDGMVHDSSYFRGDNFGPVHIFADSGKSAPQILTLTLPSVRLFPRRHEASHRSVLPIHIEARLRCRGQVFTRARDFSVGISCPGPRVCFSRLSAFYTQENFTPGNPAYVVSPFLNLSHFIDSVRHKLHLVHSELDCAIKFAIDDQTEISRIDYRCITFQSDSGAGRDTLSWTMHSIRKDTIHTFQFDLRRLINTFPDSLGYVIDYSFAKNEIFTFDKKTFLCTEDTTAIVMDIFSVVRLDLYTVWGIDDTIQLHSINTVSTAPLRKASLQSMRDKQLIVSLGMKNESHFNGTLFATGYPDVVDGLPVAFFGDNGLSLPRRGTTQTDSVVLNDKNLRDILTSDSLRIEWDVVLPPLGTDALRDTDYVFLDAHLTLEGVQTTDGLLDR